MPIYEYKCDRCDHQFEILQKISDAALQQCPACQSDSLRKLVSAVAFKLKGTGWYETDFKDKKGDPKQEKQTQTTKEKASAPADKPKEKASQQDKKPAKVDE